MTVSPPWAGLDLLTNVDPALAAGWHPVARSEDVTADGVRVRLLGHDVAVRRVDGQLCTRPTAQVTEHVGLVWVAPEPPVADLLEVPEFDDGAFVPGWLPTLRTRTPVGLLADNFLDLAHFPFVHAATFGAEDEPEVAPYDVVPERGGFGVEYEHDYRNVEDPAVALGLRPLVQRRRVSYRFRLPFQLRLRLDHLDSGGTTVILFHLQPEDLDASRIWSLVLRRDDSDGDSAEPRDMDATVAYELAVVREDLALSEQFLVAGLPLDPRAEMHIRPDASGLALRSCLRALRAARGVTA